MKIKAHDTTLYLPNNVTNEEIDEAVRELSSELCRYMVGDEYMKLNDVKLKMKVVIVDAADDPWLVKGEICEVVGVDRPYAYLKRSNGEQWWVSAYIFEPYKPEFKVGERVKIRSWESMESEFGLSPNGDIICFPLFTKGSRHLCGCEAEIKEIRNNIVCLNKCSDISIGELRNCGISILEKIEEKKETKEMDNDFKEALEKLMNIGKFNIEGSKHNPYEFTKDGLMDCDGDERNDLVSPLFTGGLLTTKLPFKPAKGEWYWSVTADGGTGWTMNDCDKYDCNAFLAGNCFRTEEEALVAAPEISKKMQEFCK